MNTQDTFSRWAIWISCITLALTAIPSFAAGGGASRLSQKPIPLQTEAFALFSYEDISDYEGLIKAIKMGAEDESSPGGRVWAFLPPLLKNDVDAAGDHFDDTLKYRILNGLNGVIRRTDLYDADAFASVEVEGDLRQTLESGLEDLGAIEATSKNRDLLKASFPKFISASKAASFPKRPQTYRIFGDDFLNRGNLQKGIELPGGAVWQPSLLTFGTFRSAWQYQDTGNRLPSDTSVPGPPILGSKIKSEEWVNRLDLFFNLYLTQTERIVLGFRPIDQDGEFSGYHWQPDSSDRDGWEGDLDSDIEVFFFEGDFGEIFPKLDRLDRRDLDIGFAVGRQPMFIQEGMMINDVLDGFGLVRNNNLFLGIPNMRITAFYAWQNVNRGVGPGINERVDDAELYGVFTSFDTRKTTIDIDIAYVDDKERVLLAPDMSLIRRGGDQLNVGIGAVQRIGKFNTAFRVNHSFSLEDDESLDSSDGTLVFGELSWTVEHTADIVYANAFWANDDFKSASRDPSAGGPLGRVGILFDAFGIGSQGSPLNNNASESVGGAIGYQRFFGLRRNLILEGGWSIDTDGRDREEYGVGARWQQAISNHYILRLDAYYVERTDLEDRKGIRGEFVIQF